MPKRIKKAAVDLDEIVTVGEGADAIENWYEGFDVLDEIKERLWDGPELDWDRIAGDLAAYPEFLDQLDELDPLEEGALLELFEKFPGAGRSSSFYDQGSPGCSGFDLQVFVTRRNLTYVQKAFSALLKAIEDQLEK
jgi:hypothetical protein